MIQYLPVDKKQVEGVNQKPCLPGFSEQGKKLTRKGCGQMTEYMEDPLGEQRGGRNTV